jgi:YHS domain-containing protein
MRWIPAVAILTGAILLAGCRSKEEQVGKFAGSASSQGTGRSAETAPAETQSAITQKICPVMGGKINPTVYTDHEGKRIYFCCPECIDTFKKDPAKYLAKMR